MSSCSRSLQMQSTHSPPCAASADGIPSLLTSGATQRGCVMRLTFRLAVLHARRLVKPKSPILTCTKHTSCDTMPRPSTTQHKISTATAARLQPDRPQEHVAGLHTMGSHNVLHTLRHALPAMLQVPAAAAAAVPQLRLGLGGGRLVGLPACQQARPRTPVLSVPCRLPPQRGWGCAGPRARGPCRAGNSCQQRHHAASPSGGPS